MTVEEVGKHKLLKEQICTLSYILFSLKAVHHMVSVVNAACDLDKECANNFLLLCVLKMLLYNPSNKY